MMASRHIESAIGVECIYPSYSWRIFVIDDAKEVRADVVKLLLESQVDKGGDLGRVVRRRRKATCSRIRWVVLVLACSCDDSLDGTSLKVSYYHHSCKQRPIYLGHCLHNWFVEESDPLPEYGFCLRLDGNLAHNGRNVDDESILG